MSVCKYTERALIRNEVKKKALCEAKACLVSPDSLITHTKDRKVESQLGHTIHD